MKKFKRELDRQSPACKIWSRLPIFAPRGPLATAARSRAELSRIPQTEASREAPESPSLFGRNLFYFVEGQEKWCLGEVQNSRRRTLPMWKAGCAVRHCVSRPLFAPFLRIFSPQQFHLYFAKERERDTPVYGLNRPGGRQVALQIHWPLANRLLGAHKRKA